METTKDEDYNPLGSVFKSYYVVWKPGTGKQNNKSGIKFKSYYVVWKLFQEISR